MTLKQLGRKIYFLVFIVFLLFIASCSVLADNGDGSGGGKNNLLALVSSDPSDGQKDVTLPVQIKLVFSKNVINMTVKDNNLQCFSLWDEGGEQIPVEVRMGDDQIQPELKRDIALVPLRKLEPGKGYTVKILGALQSKSGATMENDVKVNFETAAANEKLDSKQNVSDGTSVPETTSKDPIDSPAETEKQDVIKQDVTKQAAKQTEGSNNVSNSSEAESDTPENSVNKYETVKKQLSDQENIDTAEVNSKRTGIWIALAVAAVIGICWMIVKRMRKGR